MVRHGDQFTDKLINHLVQTETVFLTQVFTFHGIFEPDLGFSRFPFRFIHFVGECGFVFSASKSFGNLPGDGTNLIVQAGSLRFGKKFGERLISIDASTDSL